MSEPSCSIGRMNPPPVECQQHHSRRCRGWIPSSFRLRNLDPETPIDSDLSKEGKNLSAWGWIYPYLSSSVCSEVFPSFRTPRWTKQSQRPKSSGRPDGPCHPWKILGTFRSSKRHPECHEGSPRPQRDGSENFTQDGIIMWDILCSGCSNQNAKIIIINFQILKCYKKDNNISINIRNDQAIIICKPSISRVYVYIYINHDWTYQNINGMIGFKRCI